MCPELQSKGADTLVRLRFLSDKLQRQSPRPCPGIVLCVWAAEKFIGCLAHASIFLEPEERNTACTLGMLYVGTHVALASQAVQAGEMTFEIHDRNMKSLSVHFSCTNKLLWLTSNQPVDTAGCQRGGPLKKCGLYPPILRVPQNRPHVDNDQMKFFVSK